MPVFMNTPLRTDEELEAAYAQGLLRKEELEDGAYYQGLCRNAQVARWHAGAQRFVYERRKLANVFYEAIKHPADDRHYDVFRVLKRVDPEPNQVLDDARFERTATGGLRG